MVQRGTAEEVISLEIESFQRRAGEMWRGMEKEAVIALVRALDLIALRQWRGSDLSREPDLKSDLMVMSMGAATALRPFLAVVKHQPGGVPWGPCQSGHLEFAYDYLRCCGMLVHFRRMAGLERYGLARTSWMGDELLIEVRGGAPEWANRLAIDATRHRRREPLTGGESEERHWRRIRRRMKSYVGAADGWFIRYDNDMSVVEAYRRMASEYGDRFMEGEALGDGVIIGDRSFADWRTACDHALGRVMCHVDFALILTRLQPRIAVSDVATIFARRDDVEAVWIQAGLPAQQVASTMDALTLSVDGLADWERSHETPCPFYIDLGQDFVLLPCFGALTNPYFALFRHLRNAYRIDWDRGLDERESRFRSDLRTAFAEPRFDVPGNGFKLRRGDGSTLTDIDAVVLDRQAGRMAILQLKWHDVFGFSLTERESRRRNLLQANEWVDRVSTWIGGRDSAEIASALGMYGGAQGVAPVVFVLARYAARFAGDGERDGRASWAGWHEVRYALESQSFEDPLADIPVWLDSHAARSEQIDDFHVVRRFPGLAIDLRRWD